MRWRERKLNLVLDFDSVMNNELLDVLNTFKKLNFNDPYELFALYLLYEDIYGEHEWEEIIRKVFEKFDKEESNELTKKFMEIFEKTPNYSIFEILDRENIKAIVVSRSSENEIRKFLTKWGLKRYVKKIYGKAPKWSMKFWKSLGLEKNNTLVIGDKLYDIIIPKYLGYKVLLCNPLDFDISQIMVLL